MHDRRISGADDPRAISVRFATVAFHTVTVNGLVTPEGSSTICVVSLLVITSIATMKMSATIVTPTKVHSSRLSHIRGRSPRQWDGHHQESRRHQEEDQARQVMYVRRPVQESSGVGGLGVGELGV